jgi:aspartate/methionine/tyrosine aminotransferase
VVEIATDAAVSALPSPAAIEAALGAGAKVIYLESPARLTGESYDAPSLKAIATLLEAHDAAAIWDQGLAPWSADYLSLATLPGMSDRVVTVGEAWPGMGLESWPVSYIGGKAEWLEPMRSLKQVMSICTSTASQYAALAASYHFTARQSEQMRHLASARQAALAHATASGATPIAGDALSILAVRDGGGAAAKLTAGGYTWADGADFGAPGILRLAITPDGALATALA